MPQRPQIFISYAKENHVHAKKLRDDLVRAGERVWLDTEEILSGQNWKHVIREAILKSRYVIAQTSNLTLEKVGFNQRELKEALERQMDFPPSRIYLIPARLEECDLSSTPLSFLQWVDLFHSRTDGVNKILSAIAFEHGYALATGRIDLDPEYLDLKEIEGLVPAILHIRPTGTLVVLNACFLEPMTMSVTNNTPNTVIHLTASSLLSGK